MKCRDAVELIGLLTDRRLSAHRESMLRFHLNGCAACRRTMAAYAAISGAVSALPDPEPPENLEAAVRARLETGNYDAPSPAPSSRLLFLRRAAVILPFAATLILAAKLFMPTPPPGLAEDQLRDGFTPIPPSAYTRPVTLTTF